LSGIINGKKGHAIFLAIVFHFFYREFFFLKTPELFCSWVISFNFPYKDKKLLK